jgi:hypothetical protein
VKITIALDPAEDGAEKVYETINASDMFAAIREYAEWMRQAAKYADDDDVVKSAGPEHFRKKLYAVLENHGITLEA